MIWKYGCTGTNVVLADAAAMGFKGALQKMEELELIEMGDIDRSPKHSDQEKWNDSFN